MKTEQIYKLFLESAGVTTDSRNIGHNQLFFALWGEKFNGNEYAAEAIRKGASWAIIDDPQYESENTILVDDCLLELQALASHHRKQLNIPVLAVTGTNGKTTTKELLASVLSRKYNIHYTKGNLNNHIGVPLTILSAPSGTQIMIIEMGANHIGEIKILCQIAKPDYGIITNIGKAHIEGFGSFEGVIRAKTELYDYIKSVNGVALYNDKDPLITSKIFNYVIRAVPFSDPAGLPLIIEKEETGMNLTVKILYNKQTYIVKTNLFGSYNYWNIKAAVATGLFFEVPVNDVIAAIEGYIPGNNRSQIKITDKNRLICDSYNANPSSMHQALDSFRNLSVEPRLAILGDMLELGDQSEQEHAGVVEELYNAGIKEAMLVGKNFSRVNIVQGFKTFPDVASLSEYIRKNPVKGYTILIKGSRGIGLERIYDLL
ncbi:MAG TPA: UDP-N-acetylmuramoyl-tripeptide--D-alanyl-D-alanine ligase [Bacteroidales bacterium]|nr:UDP-N-acetylmuramoyl-tripeptide--D-alanyl-D-alanine ligase [Bacteroidales bacterium]